MEYISVNPVIETAPYMDYLHRVEAQLPVGAREFALDRNHYNFYSTKCVKDLELSGIQFSKARLNIARLSFEPNRWKHDLPLSIVYSEVFRFSFSKQQAVDSVDIPVLGLLGQLVVDEIRLAATGVVHEILFTGGSIVIEAGDLSATWSDRSGEG